MLTKICSEETWSFIKIHVVPALFLVALLLPFQKYNESTEGVIEMEKFIEKIKNGPSQNQMEIPFADFLQFLSKNPYEGTWLSSIKESKLLDQQNGTIQVRSQLKSSKQLSDSYSIKIKIFDGSYRDGGDFQIVLDSSSIRTQQQFISNHLIYQTTAPLIGLSRYEKVFISQKEKPIYINKLKFRLNLNETLKIQLLLAAEYEINVITQGLGKSWEFTHQTIFALLIFIQVAIQALGSYRLLCQVQEQDMIAKSISPTMIKLGISFDTAQICIFCYLVYQYDMKILVFPTYFLIILVIYLEYFLFSKISPIPTSQHSQPQLDRIQNQVMGYNSDQQLNTNEQNINLLNNSNIKPLVQVIEKNRNYLMCICSFFVFYLNNMQNYIYFIYFFIILIPQITRNCRIGNKVNYSFESILAFAYPRLIPILYAKFFGVKSLFILQPCYIFCLVILISALAFSSLLFIQKKYGARSILPKFLIPKGLKTKFKFFMIQDQNTTCLLCGSQLASLPPELKTKSKLKQEIVYNKVVVTPCHHQFHAHCLQKWMESRVQCPSCSQKLPPAENI